jgi:mRNA interferase MazF
VSFEQYSVVVVPFPFADRAAARRRPAVVVSAEESLSARVGHSIMAMITSAGNPPWPLDVQITELEAAGLPRPSVVRMKLFTLDDRLVLRVAGRLARADAARVGQALHTALAATPSGVLPAADGLAVGLSPGSATTSAPTAEPAPAA